MTIEISATDVTDPLERIIWCAEHGERPNRREFKDAEQAVGALSVLLIAVVNAYGEEPRKHCETDDCPSCIIYDALAACRKVGLS